MPPPGDIPDPRGLAKQWEGNVYPLDPGTPDRDKQPHWIRPWRQAPMKPDAPRIVRAGGIEIGNHLPFVLIAGPCQIESREHALEVAQARPARFSPDSSQILPRFTPDSPQIHPRFT